MTEAQNAAPPLDLTDYGDAVLFAAEAQRAGFPRVAVAPEHFLALVAEVSTVRRERDEARGEVARLRAIRHDAHDAAGLRRLCEERGPESIIVCPIQAVRELIACRSCKGSGIVRRLGWDGTPDEDWCDCPAGDAYRAEVESRPPATSF